ncbi:MAG TPA: hypothetical protein VE987_17180 [Polyangiaceae bacterium]|nr:hypothetical protein [Polyangiaceae bacterium]
MNRTNPYLTEEDNKKAAASIDALEQLLRKFGKTLAPDERRALAKMKPGGDQMLKLVVQLARKHGLSVASVSLADLEAALAGAEQARLLLTACTAITTAVSDLVLRAEATAWSGTTLYYSLLSRLANNDPVLLAALEPASAFFGRRSAPVKKQRMVERADREAAQAGRKLDHLTKKAAAVHARVDGEAPATPPASPSATTGAPPKGTSGNGTPSNGDPSNG